MNCECYKHDKQCGRRENVMNTEGKREQEKERGETYSSVLLNKKSRVRTHLITYVIDKIGFI